MSGSRTRFRLSDCRAEVLQSAKSAANSSEAVEGTFGASADSWLPTMPNMRRFRQTVDVFDMDAKWMQHDFYDVFGHWWTDLKLELTFQNLSTMLTPGN